MGRTGRHKIRYYDILAAALCILLFGWFFITVKNGLNYMDESFYLVVAQRFAKGDRPLVDEWHLSQLAELLLVPFYSAFRACTGGTKGIILFMRHMFLLTDLLFYWLIYRRLRSHGIWGVFAVCVFCAYVPFALFAISYYTMPPRLLMLICCILFFSKAPSRKHFLLCGFLLSVTVLIEPPFSVLYILYSLAVWIYEIGRKRRPDLWKDHSFLFCRSAWGWISLPVCICLAVFIVFLLCKSGARNILVSLPEIFADSEYDYSAGGFIRLLCTKFSAAADLIGWGNVVLSLGACILIAVSEKRGKNQRLKKYWLCLSVCLLVSCFAYPIAAQLTHPNDGVSGNYALGSPVPFFAFGLINYLLCEKKDKKLFLILATSVVSTLLMDTFSDIAIGICLIMCAIPGFLCFGQVLREQRSLQKADLSASQGYGKNKKKIRRGSGLKEYKRSGAILTAAEAALGVFFALVCINVCFEGNFVLFRNSTAAAEISSGPYQGICTDAGTCAYYNETLADLDLIKSQDVRAVSVFNPSNAHQFAFLYLDLPISNCSSWYSPNALDRQLRYFEAFPDKRPDVLYFYEYNPFIPGHHAVQRTAILEFTDLICEGTVTQGQQGVIVNVSRWKDLSRPELQEWLAAHNNDLY